MRRKESYDSEKVKSHVRAEKKSNAAVEKLALLMNDQPETVLFNGAMVLCVIVPVSIAMFKALS